MVRFALMLLVLPWLAASPALAAKVSDIRVVGDSERTRMVLDVEGEPRFHILRLRAPYRLVVDLPDTEFAAPASKTKAIGLVSDYRFGQIAASRGRVVLDLTGPVEVEKSYLMPGVAEQPARLVLDMVPSTAEAFSEAAAPISEPTPALASLQEGEEGASPESHEIPIDRPETADSRPVVVIDPGHGGIDSGAISSDGLLEKDITLSFSKALREVLLERGKTIPILTRDDDVFLSLGKRVAFARREGAALFISVHADTVPQDYVRGATVYTLSEEASDVLAARLAARENRADILAGLAIEDQPDEVATILFDLARRETRNLSMRFAADLVKDLSAEMVLNKKPRRGASFRVLKAPDVPSVLLELGYLSNNVDEKLFQSDEWRERTSEAVASAVEKYLALPGVARR
ncbi:N-acetylmuramoyl-L-alanine amidase [Afifella marina]|uniref:N-acetylmuramoyl-L-alanine amidase n=1 Tax=Afifella marina DSM 2698 TaxID=1120955 RepID=A0A1G5NKK6_AFIMA|nr:N-acetylmuramoyl-L-alanine amidase [Afifella marina]MBK1623734.1 N-acetylmuramoyl-L-alanine amidase [Afifella marina DSM 2698]MBK1626728.1 N-acetylmuramoyl-L-alanine amidase [Afifella marina]MBK5916276.1 hypothetical protein [Afifella marina]RAI21536.1 hypothetical protein CH311_05795 [Afifella marina DSM 2698]SCZ37955.1 N-acetylmuramoyl-L-alanine amidase [Afifella marina DSM 2698]